MNPAPSRYDLPSDVRCVFISGLVAGTVDIGAAALIYRINPLVVMRAIATGLQGAAAFKGGMGSSALGLGLQWAMSIVIAGIYLLAVRWIPRFRHSWVQGGILAGIIIFVVMNYVVVPLSAVGKIPRFSTLSFLENLAAMILFGLILAYFFRSRTKLPI